MSKQVGEEITENQFNEFAAALQEIDYPIHLVKGVWPCQYSALTPGGELNEQFREWMKENMFDQWDLYIAEWMRRAVTGDRSYPWYFDEMHFFQNFYTWMRDNVKWWAYEECYCNHCRKGPAQMHWTHPCEQCGGLGGIVIIEKYSKAVEMMTQKEEE